MVEGRSPVQVVGVMSSARVQGNTATLARAALGGAQEAGARTAEVVLVEHQIEFCQGCLRCMSEGRCVLSDDFEALRELVSAADGIILSAPTYGQAPCARMKNLIDRFGLFEYFTSSAFGGKYLVGLSTANSAGAARKVARGLAYQVAGGVFRPGYVSGFLGVSSRGKGVAEDSEALTRAHALGRKLVQDIQASRRFPLQNLLPGLVNRLIVKPNFRTAILNHREGMMRGVYASLQERGLL